MMYQKDCMIGAEGSGKEGKCKSTLKGCAQYHVKANGDVIACKKCGFKHICPNCSLYLTFHKIRNKAICHHCSFEKKIAIKCKLEKNCEFVMYGMGVEKIFDEIREIFHHKKVNIF